METPFDTFVETMFNDHFRLPSTGYQTRTDKKGDAVMTIEMPGVKKEDLKLHIEEGKLRIEAKRDYPSPKDYGSTFTLARSVDLDKIKAELQNGILVLKLPKKDSAKPKLIEVQ